MAFSLPTTITQGFWAELPRPFFALAPMADVTDTAFRRLVAKYSRHGEPGGGPDIFWTEFVSTDGLLSPGREVLLRDFEFTDNEHPIVAQIFGATPQNFYDVAKQCVEMGFDGIDINSGCPDRSVCKQGAGSALIKTPSLAQEIIAATQEGAGDVPVSIKTRLGWSSKETESWIGALLEARPAVISVHARTKTEMSKSDPDWDAMKIAVELAHDNLDANGNRTLMMANGAIRTHQQGQEICDYTGCDGIMMGKAIFGNPWLFDKNIDHRAIPIKERLRVMIEHTKLFMDLLGDIKNFAIMKKHFKAYVHGFPGAKELRIKLMATNSVAEIEEIVAQWIENHSELAIVAPNEEYIV